MIGTGRGLYLEVQVRLALVVPPLPRPQGFPRLRRAQLSPTGRGATGTGDVVHHPLPHAFFLRFDLQTQQLARRRSV